MNDKIETSRECELFINLENCKKQEISNEGNSGVTATISYSGVVDDNWYEDFYYGKSSKFHNKNAEVRIYTPIHKEVLERERKNFLGGIGDLCGVVRVAEGVNPESYERNEKTFAIDPIQIDLFLKPADFEIFLKMTFDSYFRKLKIQIKFTLIGEALNNVERKITFPPIIKPRELDISIFNGYGIRDFKLTALSISEA